MKPFAHLKCAASSDIGKKRKNNEDAFGMFPESGIFCVADGMGGGDDGEIASAAVVRTVEDLAARMKPDESGGVCADDVGSGLAVALSTVSAWICNRAHVRKLNGCGSTFVGVVFDPTKPAQALAVHAGDSRLYLLHGHSIRQITRDHSVAELMGEKDESKVNPMFRSMVINGIGIRDKAEPEFTPFKIAPGDRILLCSDGLSRMVPDKRIASVARAEESPEKAVSALIAAALDAGGVDNVTAVLVQVGELPSPLTPRKPLPPPQPTEDSETENGDSPTTSDDTGKTDETRTCATQFSGITEADAFDIETPKPAGSFAAKPSRLPVSRRTLWLVLTVVLVAIVCVIIALFGGQRRGEGHASTGQEVSASVQPSVSTQPPVLVKPVTPLETPALVKSAEPVKAAEPQTEKVVQSEGKEISPAADNSVKQTERVVPLEKETSVAPSAPPKAPNFAADLVAACGADSVQAFVRTLRRLLPHDDRNADFDKERERFLKRARELVQRRGGREAEAAVVDLRVLLQNAESARSSPVLQKADAVAKSVLSAWDDVLNGNPADVATQMSCARLIKTLKDLR